MQRGITKEAAAESMRLILSFRHTLQRAVPPGPRARLLQYYTEAEGRSYT